MPASLREALESALVADPDDRSAYMAYADYLAEQGDPRGELIQVQLALEDGGTSPGERERLRAREKELLDAHQRDWLGPLAGHLLGESAEEHGVRFRFARGWLDTVHARRLVFDLARLLTRSDESRLLRELSAESTDYEDEWPGDPGDVELVRYERPALCALRRAPALGNVRVFRLGEDQGEDFHSFRNHLGTKLVPEIVCQMPRLEELTVWGNGYDPELLYFGLPAGGTLRVLKLYHLDVPHRLDVLAASPAARNLTHLLFHPHYTREYSAEYDPHDEQDDFAYLKFADLWAVLRSPHLQHLTHLQLRVSSLGDDGCEEIVRSGILKRLTRLDLRHGRITDTGARALASCPDIHHLEYLDVERNGLTPEGVALLEALGTHVRARDQMGPGPALRGEYLYEGEFE
jgi:uncharacterized protein (TIGR02996 family)